MAARPSRVPCPAPVQKAVTAPVGITDTSRRSDRGSGTDTGGAVVADRVMGTRARETSTEASTNSSNPAGSPPARRSCPPARPPIMTTM